MRVPYRESSEIHRDYLVAELDRVRDLLERYVRQARQPAAPAHAPTEQKESGVPTAHALDVLCQMFGLSSFERNILLVCAGVELDSRFADVCASAHGDPTRACLTFGLALAALPDPHWSALSPSGPLRHWRLIDIDPRTSLTLSPVRIDEHVLHYLVGVSCLDERLEGFIEILQPGDDPVPSHHAVAQRIAAVLSRAASGPSAPVVQLCGGDAAGKRSIAAAVCAELGLNLAVLPAQALPALPAEVEALIRLWEREAALSNSALLFECDEFDSSDGARDAAISRVIEHLRGVLLVATRQRRRVAWRDTASYDIEKPTPAESRALWLKALGRPPNPDGKLDALVAQFHLGTAGIRAACAEAFAPRDAAAGSACDLPEGQGDSLWNACRRQARQSLDDLAQRLDPVATWPELVLPDAQMQMLREIGLQVRQRSTVYDAWGFASRGSRGLGISALFAGPSGTGKTMAAEVLAHELRLDLYRIDLSQVVSKYIGETEKNLRRVFDAAEDGGAILLFDEADALFGKRSEVKDSHDRYANIEISYLLQRMETYRGLAILTTNMKESLDPAFLRRIRFVVTFPFPDTAQRAAIWRRIFPVQTPIDGLEADKLARLNIAGGNIRNIALYGAFLAADAGEPVRMVHLLRGARVEYAKLERPLTDGEIAGWAPAPG